ncbi:HAD family hydrolase [Exiguobacterium artemiae]|uniref:HAD family hydrolase n=1 Tax=Exiguobacterium artemiae TaxID=340145 RepID=UPI0029643E52|nr:HAD family hydrolase [Exiguobacterium sibiricum]MDW2885366.1 HAD family hydrolase [Exiguobacterium sibiricum]
MPIQALLFDLDGTLLDREMSLVRFIADQHLRLIAPISDCPADAYQTLFIEWDQRGLVWKDLVYQQLVAHFQLNVSPEVLLDDYLTGFAKTSVLFPGTIPLLESLSPSYRLGLITNGRSDLQRSVIETHGLQDFFDPILISEEVGLSKPNPTLFLRPVQDWELKPEHVLFIGDHPLHDVAGAKAVGMPALLKSTTPVDGTLHDWSQLSTFITRLNQESRFYR